MCLNYMTILNKPVLPKNKINNKKDKTLTPKWQGETEGAKSPLVILSHSYLYACCRIVY